MSDKEQTQLGGKHRGTDFVITPGADSVIPEPGNELHITMIAKTWKKQRGMKRGITATFVPVVFTPPTDFLVCD